MKLLAMKLLALFLFAAGLLYARDAHAIAACNNNSGLSPRQGTTLPPRPQLLVFDTDEIGAGYAAKINGKRVPIKTTKLSSGPYEMLLLQIDSDATGALRLYQFWPDPSSNKQPEETEIARYAIKAKAALPDKIKGEPRRFTREIQHSSVEEKYDALVLELGDAALAIKATVKLRRDDKAQWRTLEVPVVPGDWMDKRTVVRIGKLGCESNYSTELLEAGVDIEATVTLVDGSTRQVSLPAHLKLPKAAKTP